MIADFLASWPLFHDAWLAGWLSAVLLALVGVVVVAREQIFLGAAVGQASMLGITVGIRLGDSVHSAGGAMLHSDAAHSVFGGVFAIAAALATGTAGGPRRESAEALTGWIFLVGASISVLMVAHSPHGLAEVQRLLSSTLLGATPAEVWLFASAVVWTVAAIGLRHRPLRLVVMDVEMARAVGIAVGRWNAVLATWLGVVVALSLHAAGLVFTFGGLVLPALAARNLCREIISLFWCAPVLALASAVPAFVVANHQDLPPAQVTVALECVVLLVAWVWRARRSSR
jgi:ABC-type Mn2+/Zn2+ transport system permease subunit